MHKGPGTRTPRTRAEQIGTASQGFTPETYDATAGVPTGAGMPTSKYKDAADAAQPKAEPRAAHGVPFKITGNPY